MKNTLVMTCLFFLLTAGRAARVYPGEAEYGRDVGAGSALGSEEYGADLDLDYCYNYLAPFGTWVSLDPWGYVWCPRHMGYNWRPYSEGHWVWTDYGWTWISDFDWGWIPFHYGRWGWDDDFGWFWVPGTAWGPAWVTWRSSDLYCGWAPFPPGIEFRAGIDFASIGIDIPFRFWVFVGASHFCDRDIFPYVLPYERNITIIHNTRIYNNFSWRGNRFVNDGINVDTIRRLTRREVPRYALQDARQPGRAITTGNQVQLYRPSFRSTSGARPKTFLSPDQAHREIGPARVFESREQPPRSSAETAVRKRQDEERRIMQQSQSEEMKAMERQRSQEQQRAKAAEERAKIQQDYQARKAEMAKQHQDERQQMNERHKNDTERVRNAGQQKQQQQAPPPKKKK
jgi:hypothetical protein